MVLEESASLKSGTRFGRAKQVRDHFLSLPPLVVGLGFAGVLATALDGARAPRWTDHWWYLRATWFVVIIFLNVSPARRFVHAADLWAWLLSLVAVPVALALLYLRLTVGSNGRILGLFEPALVLAITVVESVPRPLPLRTQTDRNRLWWRAGRGILVAAAGTVALAGVLLILNQVRFSGWLVQQHRTKIAGGAPKKLVRVVEFTDYQCPFCSARHFDYEPAIARIATELGDRVGFEKFDFPLEAECNGWIQSGLHPLACEAAVLVRLAAEHKKRAEVEDYLYSNQDELTATKWPQILERFGLASEFRLRYREIVADVSRDVTVGVDAGVRGTPTFFVNGIRIGSDWTTGELERLIRREAK
jgi:hypothetical protein